MWTCRTDSRTWLIVFWTTLVLNQSLQREFTNSSKNAFLWSWAQHVLFITYWKPGGSRHTGTRGKHTQFKPHGKAICIYLTSCGHMEMLSKNLSTQQQREDLLYLANNLSTQSRICCTKKLIRQPQAAPSRLHLQWIFWNLQVTAFYVFISVLLFWKFWCFCLILLEVSSSFQLKVDQILHLNPYLNTFKSSLFLKVLSTLNLWKKLFFLRRHFSL